MLAHAIAKAFHNLLNPGILKLLLLSILLYIAGWLGLATGIAALITHFVPAEEMPFGLGWLASGIGSGMLAWFLFPLLYPVLISFFDEAMADKIERSDYPELPRANPPFWPTFWHDIRFTLKALLLNIVCFPLYFLPLIGQLLYFGMNGYLLGAQFFRMAAGRRVDKQETETLLKEHKNTITLAGAAIMLCATIPFLNLAAPVLGVATLLHVFHAIRKDTPAMRVINP